MSVSEIIELLGGDTVVADGISAPVTTVNSWKANLHIPKWRQPALLRLAAEKGVALSTADFPARPAKEAA